MKILLGLFLRAKFVVLVAIIAFISVIPLLRSGLPPTHDGEYHVVRFYEFDKVIRDGNWYPRWAPDFNNGYGTPLFNYVYPLPNYLAFLFHLLGASFIYAFKLNMFFASIIGAIFFYLWARLFWGSLASVASSVIYTFSPYHFVDIYVRGSVGEVWALALLPAFLWSISKFINNQKRVYFFISSVFFALVIFSHNILALMFFPFSIFYIMFVVWLKEKKYLVFPILLIIFLGLGTSSIFWLPALFERSYVVGLEVFNIKDNFPQVYQLIFPSWGTGFSNQDLARQMSFQIGIVNILAVILSFLGLTSKNKKEIKIIIFYFIGWFIVIFFMLLKASLLVWQNLPLIYYFQFPWRLLSLEILVTSFLAGSLSLIKFSRALSFLMIILSIVLTINYTKPAYYHQRNDNYYITKSNFIDGTNSPGNAFNTKWTNPKIKKQKGKVTINEPSSIVTVGESKIGSYSFKISIKKDSDVVINTAYFPGWTVFVNGEKREIKNNKDGLISFSLSKGTHGVGVKFLDTTIRKISNGLFFLSIFLFLFLYKNYSYVTMRK